ncbi:hypothetical protein GPECTOR_16g684 [Gonium pectorale]|uniref:Replication protein A subunit n=1 Tax=Gonium pectorale TaxID=33097 RepID=A0A150GKY2_GONPE|nr:hypothetical protein GPECTOR_16g684 [Gonium pectorale]|eukprot:KXZ50509.1 hypothetical protein GPECTOR_16g684 [Gonium pectorale]
MATATLTIGDVARIKSKGEFPNGVVLRFADLVASGEISNGCLVKISTFTTNTVGNEEVLLATELTVVQRGVKAEPMDTDTALTSHNMPNGTPEAAGKPQPSKTPTTAPPAKENNTPQLSPPTDFKFSKTPGPGLSPVSFLSPAPTPTPGAKAAVTPGSIAVSDRKNYNKIGQLHPYESNWCIKAKLERKAPLRSSSIRGTDIKILTIDLVDDTGEQIQGTFWRGAAERYADQLVEGKVYIFSRFKVKPADKKYSSFKANYQIDFTDGTEVSEAADQDTTAMTAAVDVTPIEMLPRRVGGRALVDVAGVVLSLGPLGTVKRKADSSELPRRDVTLGDSSGKSVVVTLWGETAHATAAQLDGQEGRVVLQVTQARVTDFNGCSISSLSKSVVTINPEGPLTEELLSWYSASGMAADRFTPVGQDLPGTRATSGGGAGGVPSREKFLTLKDVTALGPDALPDDKAIFQGVTAYVAMVNADQQMYYLANPENGRKVVDQGGGRFAEADGKVVERPEHRYVLGVKLADHTGEVTLQLFNKEAEAVMGMKADDLAALKDSSSDAFAAALRSAAWRPWSVVVMSKAREYNGERRVRHTAHRVDTVDWAAEAQRLVGLIQKYEVAV